MGVSVDAWLRGNGLSEARLAEADLWVSRGVFERLVLDALSLSEEPALGLFVGERLVASTHGMVGFAALNSGTIREAFGVFERFISIRTSLLETALEERERDARMVLREVEPLGAMKRPVFEAVLLSVKNVLSTISMGAARIEQVSFDFEAPPYKDLARELFGCAVRYGQAWTGFAIERGALDEPLKLSDPTAFRVAAEVCQRELDKLEANTTLSARVRRLLVEQQSGFPSLKSTARHLRLTPRTLHRRLLDEGTSYRELLEDVRRTLALAHLSAGRFSVEEVAYLLGYTDASNFRRAFKRWESTTPSAKKGRAPR
jgi:AraC-like DNA-binding protein